MIEGFKTLIEIDDLVKTGHVRDNKLLVKIEGIYNTLCQMTYFKVLISKLDRSYVNVFESGIVDINKETDLLKKHEMVYKRIGTVMTLFKNDDEKVHQLFEYISKWIEWE